MTRVIKAVSLPLGSPALQWVLNIEAQGGNFSSEMRKLIEIYSSVYDEVQRLEKINRALKMKLLLQERKRARTKRNLISSASKLQICVMRLTQIS